MDDMSKAPVEIPPVRVDFVPQAHFISSDFARLENERLWPRVWQMACREEEIAQAGNYETYNVARQSIIVLRTASGAIKAYHNACLHRGRELTVGSGTMEKVHCKFHGWQWNLDGEITRVPDRADWEGCPDMDDASLHLVEVKVGTWGGWVFINMDPDCEPFEKFIDPVPKYLDCLEFDKMRYAWRKSFVMQANWKVAMEAFMESYHVAVVHPQALPLVDPRNFATAHGRHGRHAYLWERPPGTPAALTGKPMPEDIRAGAAALGEFNALELGSPVGSEGLRDGQMSGRAAKALQRHLTETPAGLSPLEVTMLSQKYMREAAEAEGAGWPTVTPQQAAELGADWNIFPNMVLVFSFDATLVMRARPINDDPGVCMFELASICRYAPGQEPKVEREVYSSWQAEASKIPHLLTQDLSNIEAVQRGMQSIGLKGVRLNPKQEVQISHHYEVLRQFLGN
jgi:phenylpropionate dioxygenase-like ring-hydroxylating dioxygenase large terminal subunit